MIIWNSDKYETLKNDRDILLDEIEEIILKKEYILFDHPKLSHQKILILRYKDYIHAVPIVFDGNDDIVIKTVYPSRKLNKLYGDKL